MGRARACSVATGQGVVTRVATGQGVVTQVGLGPVM